MIIFQKYDPDPVLVEYTKPNIERKSNMHIVVFAEMILSIALVVIISLGIVSLWPASTIPVAIITMVVILWLIYHGGF